MDIIESSKALDTELCQCIVQEPLAALKAITELRRAIAEREREAVFRALEEHSWREVGEALGVSKQAAFQRFGKEWAVMTMTKLPESVGKQTIKNRLEE
jgi:predicted hydrocarbon binding protein